MGQCVVGNSLLSVIYTLSSDNMQWFHGQAGRYDRHLGCKDTMLPHCGSCLVGAVCSMHEYPYGYIG